MNWNTKTLKKIKYIEIKNLLEKKSLDVTSDISNEEIFDAIRAISNSTERDLSFFSNKKYLNDLKEIKAKACLIEDQYKKYLPKNCKPIIVKDPYLALAIISNMFNNEILRSNGIISEFVNINKKCSTRWEKKYNKESKIKILKKIKLKRNITKYQKFSDYILN